MLLIILTFRRIPLIGQMIVYFSTFFVIRIYINKIKYIFIKISLLVLWLTAKDFALASRIHTL